MESFHQGIGYEKACRLSNTSHSEIAPSLSLPSLPVWFGSADRWLGLSDESAAGARDQPEVLDQASAIAGLLRDCDVGYLNLKEETKNAARSSGEHSMLYSEVVKYNHEAFDCSSTGHLQGLRSHNASEKTPFLQNIFNIGQAQRDYSGMVTDNSDRERIHDMAASAGVRKPKMKRKDDEYVSSSTVPDDSGHQDIIGNFCEMVEEFCGRAENHDDMEGIDESCQNESSLPPSDIKMLVNEIMSTRTNRILQLIPIDTLVRLIAVLDRQIQRGQILSVVGNGDPDTYAATTVLCALESTYAVLAIMTHQDMPKPLYKEEVIERIIDFSKEKIMDSMAACNPLSHTPQKLSANGTYDGDEYEDDDIDDSSTVRKRQNVRTFNMKKYSGNKVSAAVHVDQKLCSIQGFLKDLLSVVRLSDSCIIHLVKTSFSTFLVDNIQLLQLKSIDLICGVFALYTQHRSFVIDETLHLLLKLQPSKRTPRAYHLPDEEQKQIQMVSALLIQLVQFSANLPEIFKTPLTCDTILDVSIDANYPIKCHEAAIEACCLFWSNVLQRFSTAKSHDVSVCKVILENLVMDLLTTLNLPEYPASASILEVLCVLLLQNAGLKSKDIPARCMAIDLLGTIAARMKRDAVICSMDKDNFWILQLLLDGKTDVPNRAKNVCSVCHNGRSVNIVCNACEKTFHADCIGVSGQDLLRDWSCHICLCTKQLSVLRSYCKLQNRDNVKKTRGTSSTSITSDSTNGLEVVQQILVNYLQETGPQDDSNLFTRWFYLSVWFKDDPSSQEKIGYYFSRLKSKSILRDSASTLSLSRNWAKKICLALGQNNSFIRGFDKILFILLASLRENSPILRAKALRAVSSIVEADPEVLCDPRVQCAVEGRFCDSAISVREAALELVGRHIASHPDVGLKYFLKVAERIKDTGVSVRKRSIKIIRDLCTSNSNFSEATNAFIEIISRVTDEESSVQDLVCKTFYEFWFEEPSRSETQFVGDGSSVPMEIATKTEQIVDVLRKMPNHHLLVTVIKRNLALDFLPQSAKATGINAVSLASVRRRCELICKRLLERILQVEERNSDEEEVLALPYVLALHAFCLVDPMLCTPATDPSQFVVTLQPYLKNKVNNRTIAQLLESIIFVIDAVLPLLRKPQQSVIMELEQDLKNMIVRHSFMTVVHACVRCLCSLSKIAGKGASLVEYLIQLFFRHLQGSNTDNKQLLGRSLFCLGLLLRYGSALIKTCNDQHLHFVESLSLLKHYLRMEDFSLKVRALQALGSLLIAKPEYMLEKDIGKILEASLSSGADSRLKMQALQNMYEYLLDAENQLVADNISQKEAKYPENAGNSVPVAAGAGDTNICGGIIQLYWNSILERCLDMNDHVRQSALKIVEIVLRQGLVHPITCVPCLVALETDPLEANSKLAHHLLMNMNEKYPAFFESRLGDGLQLSFTFVHSITNNKVAANVKGKPDGNTIAYVRTGISRMYRLIRGNRISRNKFMHSIVRKFESGTWNYASVPFLVYCTEILASLPFTCPDEPLYLIYDINRVIQLRAGGLEANMKTWSSLSRQQDQVKIPNGIHKMDDRPAMHQISEKNVTAEVPSEDSCGFSREDFQNFQADCHDAIALQLLLKLKRHLKIVYVLNDDRCQAFSLKEHPKPGETISRQNVPFNISDISTDLPSSFQDMVQKYQEFKATLKDDTMDYATYTATINRKRPPAPRSTTRGGNPAPLRGRNSSDDDEDKDWTGGARKLDFSSHKTNSVRVTRQRLQA